MKGLRDQEQIFQHKALQRGSQQVVRASGVETQTEDQFTIKDFDIEAPKITEQDQKVLKRQFAIECLIYNMPWEFVRKMSFNVA